MTPVPQIVSFQHLLELFQCIPREDRKLTFMQVAGYPHYENVCSNILAFYLKPEEDHQLNNLLLECLLELHPQGGELSAEQDIHVYREYSTSANQRIDLVIEAESYIIAIENKVYHWLANDLKHYAETIQALCGKNKQALHFVLAPTHQYASTKAGFHPITYQELWSTVENNLGTAIATADQKWLSYLLDFMETTKNFTSAPDMELSEQDQFFIKHHQQIEQLNDARNSFYGKLTSQVKHLQEITKQNSNLCAMLVKDPWIHRAATLVFDFHLADQSVAWDLVISPTGWELQCFGRNNTAQQLLHDHINKWTCPDASGDIPLRRNRYIVRHWPLDTKLSDLSEKITRLLTDFRPATQSAAQ